MNVLTAVLSLIPVIGVGDFILQQLSGGIDWPPVRRWPLALALGGGWVVVLLFCFSLLVWRQALTLTVVSTVLVFAGHLYQQRHTFTAWRWPRYTVSQWVALGLGVAFTLIAGIAALSTGLGHDGISFWALKGKVIFLEGGWPLLVDSFRWLPHPGYPLLVPALESWIYFFLGRVDEQAVKIIFALFYVALTFLFYGTVRRYFSLLLSLVFTILMAATPHLATAAALSGYADVVLMLFVFGAATLAYQGLLTEDAAYWRLAAVLAALAVWVKREGMVYWAVMLAFWCGWLLRSQVPWSKRLRDTAVALLPSIFIAAPWMVYVRWEQIPNDDFVSMTAVGLLSNIERLPVIAGVLFRALLRVGEWGILWLLAFLVMIGQWRQLKRPSNLFLLICILMPLALLSFSFVFSTWEPFAAHMNVSIVRLILHGVPLVWYLIAVLSVDLGDWLTQMVSRK